MSPEKYKLLAENTCMNYNNEFPIHIICPVIDGGGTGDTVNCHRDTAMNREQWIAAITVLAIVLIGNLGGLWLIGAI